MEMYYIYSGDVSGNVALQPGVVLKIAARAIRWSNSDTRFHVKAIVEGKQQSLGIAGQHPNTAQSEGVILQVGKALKDSEIGVYLRPGILERIISTVELKFQESPDRIGCYEVIGAAHFHRGIISTQMYFWADLDPIAAKLLPELQYLLEFQGNSKKLYDKALQKGQKQPSAPARVLV